MNAYDPADFQANEGKYRLFKTARIAAELDGFEVGQHVAVAFLHPAYNAFRERQEPLFAVRDNHGDRRVLFAAALADFGL